MTIDGLVKEVNAGEMGWSTFKVTRYKGGWIAFLDPGHVRDPKTNKDIKAGYDQKPLPTARAAAERYVKLIRGNNIFIGPCGMWQTGGPVIRVPRDIKLGFKL